MKTLKKILLTVFGTLLLAVIAGISYLKFALPNISPASDLVITTSAEKVARGEYLANSVMVCMDCHSERDWTKFSGPPIPGTLGKGGEVFDQSMGFPGKYTAKNITPYNLSSWTDGEIFRAITSGVSKDGSALFSIMPYHHYGKLDRDDIEAVIAYLRTIPSVESNIEDSKSDFPMNLILNTLPKEANFDRRPEQANTKEYGQYLVTAAGCYDCHTQQEKGKFIGEDYAGGMVFNLPGGGVLTSPNITPEKVTGIGAWTEEQFVERFKRYADSSYSPPKVKEGEFQTVMPWLMYATMKEEDLRAIYTYLQSISAIKNKTETFVVN